MADAFVQPLPPLGAVPWNLNPAIEEIRFRSGVVEDTVNTGRLSVTSLSISNAASIAAKFSSVNAHG